MVTQKPVRVGVVGHPIAQSLSPTIHGRWMTEAGLLGSYNRIDGEDLGFAETIEACHKAGFHGLNVTVPYKGAAFDAADDVSERAREIGAANLLVFKDSKISADNTDSFGFFQAVETSRWAGKREVARVLGAGGAAPAIVDALQRLGLREIQVTNRTAAKSKELQQRFDIVTTVPWDQRDQDLAGVDLLVNTTSLGMKNSPPLEFDVSGLPSHAGVFDIVTTPLVTDLVRNARQASLYAENGLAMLIYQAIPSFEAWFGETPENPIAVYDDLLAQVAGPRPTVIGLTGGIGMGKSSTAKMFENAGVPVWDADRAVHELYAPGRAGATRVGENWPSALTPSGSVDREALSRILASKAGAWAILNSIIHPLVAEDRAAFIRVKWEEGHRAVLVDVPLLFETGGDKFVDQVVVCSASEDIRRARVLGRPGMTPTKYESIVAQQMPDETKRLRADFVVETDRGFDHAEAQVDDILQALNLDESGDSAS